MTEETGTTTRVPLSVLVPVKNEAANLPRCLKSVAWADEVFVVDSASTDGSQEIARACGATVVQFAFSGTWPKKKNWSLANIPFRNEWVLVLDADETMPPEAEQEIRDIVTGAAGGKSGYWINRRFYFMGKRLNHCYRPNWNLRLFKHELGRYEKLTDSPTASGDNEVHEHVVVAGETGYLKAEMDHYAFPTIDVFLEKHMRYASWEATVELSGERGITGGALQSQSVRLKRFLRRLSRHMPFRPLLRFLYVYVVQGGFLDGREGYYLARLHGIYEFLIVAKKYEIGRQGLAPGENRSGARP